MMLLKVLFWFALAIDAGAVALLFILGLAAAKPSHTNPLSVLFLLLIAPSAVLLGLTVWFLRAQSIAAKSVALIIVALPVLFLLLGLGVTGIGSLFVPKETVSFRPAPLTAIQNAVLDNNLDAVKSSASALRDHPEAAGVVIIALHRLEKSPGNLEILRTLLSAGADPNGSYGQRPLEVAILASRKTGPAPVSMLLDAGARPDARNPLGDPALFAAAAPAVDLETLKLLLDRGAPVNTKSHSGATLLTQAAEAHNWPAVSFLLQRGADVELGRTREGRSLRQIAELAAHSQPANPEIREVLRKLPEQ